ncbi:MAG: NAD-dependent epimerase/dehydratase family protein [Pseudochelatococcus sp.]|jgi:uronate dehydrogenase|uniref:NAD-dependent epimerase/dehydratase family protein n=1 Tax=Pseudochelatococcus sp. TaxID=2020869 RepID=UPI003D90CD02
MKRLLITGAAGGLGSVMRRRLAPLAQVLRLSDIADMGPAAANEEIVPCDLADGAAVARLVEGCDGIVHLGGISVERSYGLIRAGNIDGVFNLYEAARAHGRPRIVFASSNHTVGFYRQEERLTADMPTRPDGLYGVSKVFGEALAHMYHDKFGQESALVRIGSCTEKPLNHRMLSTWISPRDFASLIERVFSVPRLGCPVIWGISANAAGWWDNSHIGYLGWRPQDNAEDWRSELDATVPRPAPDDPVAEFQGGVFTRDPIYAENG